MEEMEALEMLLKEAREFGNGAMHDALYAFLDGYQEHKQEHGSFKDLKGADYKSKMNERIMYQLDKGREALKKYNKQ